MAANVPLKRVISFLQIRFFNAPPFLKITKISSTIPETKIKTEISNSIPPILSSFPIQYLAKTCGLSLDSAISVSKKVELKEKNKNQFDSVVLFLKSHNFSDTHISELVKKQPSILHCKISSTLKPKIQFLVENGIDGLNVPKLVVASPAILFRSLEAQLKPTMAMIKNLLRSPDKIVVVVRRGSWILTTDWKQMQRNLDYLIQQGVPKSRIGELLILQPRCMYQYLSRIRYAVKMIRCMGVKTDDLRFIHALRVMLSLSESSWKRKVSIFESLGWSNDEVISTFIRSPQCLSCSEEKVRNTMDYFVNIVKVDRETIIRYPKLLTYSLEKRVIPRFTIWMILEERKLMKDKQFIWTLNSSEKDFTEQFVTKNSSKIPDLMQIYRTSKENSIRAVRS